MQCKLIKNFNKLSGECFVPADKSIAQRAILFSSIAKGGSLIKNIVGRSGQDPLTASFTVGSLGVPTRTKGRNLEVYGCGKYYFWPHSLQNIIDCMNSGTAMRLLCGILAGQKFNTILKGDESLSSRPMKRIIDPLTQMGAKIKSNDFKAPLEIYGRELHAINYESPISSAQVKSCILLAGLYAQGETVYKEPYLSRNHTEIMLKSMGADIEIDSEQNIVKIRKSELNPIEIDLVGDISSAAFVMVAGLIVPNSSIIIKNVGLNPTRTGIIDIINEMGGDIQIINQYEVCGELAGDIKVNYTPDLKGCNISGEIIPRLIDEIPIIAVLASQAEGRTVIHGASDLRNKESDRIKLTVSELSKMGVQIEELPDGMIITGKSKIKAVSEVDSYKDHRIAMSLYVAGLISENGVLINNFEWTNISFPNFEILFESLKK